MWNIRISCCINPLKSSLYYVYHQVWLSKILRFVHRVRVCVLDGSQAKQLLFSCKVAVFKFLGKGGRER